jgi:hypothetical protein
LTVSVCVISVIKTWKDEHERFLENIHTSVCCDAICSKASK